eukprot:751776-Hanusia_phi.AAC.1
MEAGSNFASLVAGLLDPLKSSQWLKMEKWRKTSKNTQVRMSSHNPLKSVKLYTYHRKNWTATLNRLWPVYYDRKEFESKGPGRNRQLSRKLQWLQSTLF